jgi:hypothetical protein
MDKDDTTRTKGFIDETTGMRHPYEDIFVGVILNGDAEVPYARLRVFGRDGLGTNRDDVRDATFCQRTRRLRRDETGKKEEEASELMRQWENADRGKVRGGENERIAADFPKKSLPSMMTLTFLNPILEKWYGGVCVCVVKSFAGELGDFVETSDIWLVFECHRYGRSFARRISPLGYSETDFRTFRTVRHRVNCRLKMWRC